MTLGGFLVGSWVGLLTRKTMIKSLEFSALSSHSGEGGEGIEMELIINASMRKPPQYHNSLKFGELPGG